MSWIADRLLQSSLVYIGLHVLLCLVRSASAARGLRLHREYNEGGTVKSCASFAACFPLSSAQPAIGSTITERHHVNCLLLPPRSIRQVLPSVFTNPSGIACLHVSLRQRQLVTPTWLLFQSRWCSNLRRCRCRHYRLTVEVLNLVMAYTEAIIMSLARSRCFRVSRFGPWHSFPLCGCAFLDRPCARTLGSLHVPFARLPMSQFTANRSQHIRLVQRCVVHVHFGIAFFIPRQLAPTGWDRPRMQRQLDSSSNP